MADQHTHSTAYARLIPRLVSEDGGKTWRIAECSDESRDDLLWDALFAPEGSVPWPTALWDLQQTLSWP